MSVTTVATHKSLKTKGVIRAPSFSTFSVVELGKDVPGRLLFPGKTKFPKDGTAGYIRSHARAAKSRMVQRGQRSVEDRLPWRDYDEGLLTSMDSLIVPDSHHHVIISARNTLNEYGYQIRVDGKWFRRFDETPVDGLWPVISVGEQGTRLLSLKEAENYTADLLTGIPLIIRGKPSSQAFLLACCSDVSHMYEVDPQGRIGPSAEAWTALSERWQQLRDGGKCNEEVAQAMESLASTLGVYPSNSKLHSVLAQRDDGSLVAFAITGTLVDIAQELAGWQMHDAILLDNGGSVGWQFLAQGSACGILLVAGPNYRPRGTVFMDMWVKNFLHPHEHGALKQV